MVFPIAGAAQFCLSLPDGQWAAARPCGSKELFIFSASDSFQAPRHTLDLSKYFKKAKSGQMRFAWSHNGTRLAAIIGASLVVINRQAVL